MIRRRLLTAGLVAASLLSVAACSDDDNKIPSLRSPTPRGDITLPSGGGDLPVTIPNVPGVPAGAWSHQRHERAGMANRRPGRHGPGCGPCRPGGRRAGRAG